jgi:Zn-dependent M28 family amino/carboxypeptidase
MRLLAAGALATIVAASLAAIRPAVLTEAERAAALAIQERGMRADIRFLSGDLLEGRSPGTRGDRLARHYLASRFEAIGLEPAVDGSWEQPLDLVGVTSSCPPSLRVSRGEEGEDLRFPADYVAFSGVQSPEARVDDAEIVFVGHGIVAPEHAWDDYKGADLRGRVLLVLNDEPGDDPRLFAGRRRLYYGRWDYKLEMAARQGAAGALIVHTDASAGYGWAVIEASFTGEQLHLPAGSGPVLPVKAWVAEGAARRVVALAGRDLASLRAAAARRDFRPIPLGLRVSLRLQNQVTRRASANVVGLLRGRDPELATEAVVYTAHHDHLGTRPGPPDGEPVVYNGALDNASGLAALLAIAEACVGSKDRPRRSVLFAAVGAEEQGLLGSEFLARRPPFGRPVANVNIDGLNVWGRTRDVPVVGLGKSSLDDWIRAIAETQGRTVVPEASPEKGAYYRSDHLSFARRGVPAAYLDAGTDVIGRPPGWGEERQRAWEGAHYHQPTDDLTADWDLAGAVEDVRLLFFLGWKVANAPLAPAWRPGDEFESAAKRVAGDGG